MKQRLLMIMGLPGTGKTTFAKALATQLNAHHLNSDIVRTQLGKRGQYDEATKLLIYESLQSQTTNLLKLGKTVIVDATFYKTSLRQPYIEISKKVNVPIEWIVITADEQIIEQRTEQKRQYSEADFAVYLKIKAQYEPPTSPHLVLTSGEVSLEKMLEQAIIYLNI